MNVNNAVKSIQEASESDSLTPAQLREAARLVTHTYFLKGEEDKWLIPAFLKDLAKEPSTYATMNALVLGVIDGTTDFIKSSKSA